MGFLTTGFKDDLVIPESLRFRLEGNRIVLRGSIKPDRDCTTEGLTGSLLRRELFRRKTLNGILSRLYLFKQLNSLRYYE